MLDVHNSNLVEWIKLCRIRETTIIAQIQPDLIFFFDRGTLFLKSLRSMTSVNFQQETLTQTQLQQLKVRGVVLFRLEKSVGGGRGGDSECSPNLFP